VPGTPQDLDPQFERDALAGVPVGHPIRWRTLRGDTFKRSAASSMVRSLVRGRPRTAVPVVSAFGIGLRGELEVREVIFPLPPPPLPLPRLRARAATRDARGK
jgi:hypothetical protein